MNGDEIGRLARPIRWWWGLDERESVHRLVAVYIVSSIILGQTSAKV